MELSKFIQEAGGGEIMMYIIDQLYKYSLYLTLFLIAFSAPDILSADDDRKGKKAKHRDGDRKKEFRGERRDRRHRDRDRDRRKEFRRDRDRDDDYKRRHRFKHKDRDRDRDRKDRYRKHYGDRDFRFYFRPYVYPYYKSGDCFWDRSGRLVCYDPRTGTYYYAQ